MKKILIYTILALFCFTGCEEDGDPVAEQHEKDIALIKEYLLENNLTAESTESGLHYIIAEKGTGEPATIFSTVRVEYTGRLLNGTVFDSGIITLELYKLIEGWQEGIPFFNKGGYGKLFVPSKLGYGRYGTSGVPENAVLIFDIKLLDVGK